MASDDIESVFGFIKLVLSDLDSEITNAQNKLLNFDYLKASFNLDTSPDDANSLIEILRPREDEPNFRTTIYKNLLIRHNEIEFFVGGHRSTSNITMNL
uniref:Uncharacterized protein n=1 Tax=Romanomermis culicivorax TaxID=13658 RepID=A0A915IB76_ROMCU